MAKTPRPIPVANPRILQVPNQSNYVLAFSSPWFGTFPAAVALFSPTTERGLQCLSG